MDRRIWWAWHHARPPILNVGCESDPAGLGHIEGTVNVDIDDWSETVRGFRQMDACVAPWPFGDGAFDTVVLGDCLDHMESSDVAIREALRVARRIVVFTLPRDVPTESPEYYKSHIEDLKKSGLVAVAPGNLARRHGHSETWSVERVRGLFRGAAGVEVDLVTLPSGGTQSGVAHYWAGVIHTGGPVPPFRTDLRRLPKVSVIVNSYRPGGLDVLFDSLRHQDYPGEWEVVFVDELWERRQDVVARLALDVPCGEFHHIGNERGHWPKCSTAAAHNAGIVRSSGDLVIWWSDYSAARPDWISQHVAAHRSWGGGNLVVNGSHFNTRAPAISSALQHFPLDPVDPSLARLITIFDHPVTSAEAFLLPLSGWSMVDGKWTFTHTGQDTASMHIPDGPVDSGYYFMKHDSVPREALVSVGGNDESFDGLHQRHDTEMAIRLEANGARFVHSHRVACRIIQIRHLMGRLHVPVESEAAAAADLLMDQVRERISHGLVTPMKTHPELFF